ncbi:MAG: hypothetical protein RJA68_835, partial [Actinomycetota bacterium]
MLGSTLFTREGVRIHKNDAMRFLIRFNGMNLDDFN